jgi:glucose-6-phosphate isomerase
MIDFNFKFALKSAIGDNGISEEDIYALKPDLVNAGDSLNKLRRDGDIGFYDAPSDIEMVRSVKEMADSLFSKGLIDMLFVIGMGGSSLGAIFLQDALYPYMRNKKTDKKIQVIFSENIDPLYLKGQLENIDIDKTLFCFVSKSGDTIEVVSQFFIIKEKLDKISKEKYKNHLLFITDQKSGFLRQFADENGLPVLNIASNIGGRYSIVTAASLFPAYCMGLDIDEFFKGILTSRDDILNKGPFDNNPVYTLASVIYLYYTQKKRNIFVIDSYSNYLKEFSRWFRQLFAESLGKDNKSPTPVTAVGVTDQHSQLQLYMDGPQDKLIGFFCLKDYGFDYNINVGGFKNYDYLNDKKLSELLLNELKGVELALALSGKPSFRVTIGKIDEFSLGELSFLCMEMVVVLGMLLGVNPFNQPGVEKGKKFAYLLMGRHDESLDSLKQDLSRLEKIKDI